MKDILFERWLKDGFIKYINKKEITKPVILTYDGHGSHLTYGTAKVAADNEVSLIFLIPHSSHVLQPLDVAIFHSLKLVGKDILKKWF